MENVTAMVQHIDKQASDHNMLVLDTKPEGSKRMKRFYFDKRWLGQTGVEKVIKSAWEPDCIGSPMYKVAYKIKRCRMALIRWSKQVENNSAVKIQKLKEEMEMLRDRGQQRDWEAWDKLKGQLDIAYKEDDMFCSQKARVQWLDEGDKNTKFFHASVMQRRQNNRIDHLERRAGDFCRNKDEIVAEISDFYEHLFRSED